MDSKKVRELTEDYIFKRVFGKKGNEDILKDLLESILEIKIEEIEVIIGTEIEKEKIEEKLGIIDLKATINKETTVDIEIQVKDYHNMIERSTFYIAGLYHTGLKRGEAYEKNNKVIGINILMFNIFDWKKFHSKGLLKENELNKVMTDKLELHFLELPKLIKNKEEGNKRLRQWLEFIYNKRKGEIEVAVQENEKIAKAQVEYKYLTGDEQVQRLAF
jgi:predicted transposase/invertase (TIGR01784 family)